MKKIATHLHSSNITPILSTPTALYTTTQVTQDARQLPLRVRERLGPTLCPILHRQNDLRAFLHQSRSSRPLRGHHNSPRRRSCARNGTTAAVPVRTDALKGTCAALDLKLSLYDAGTSYTSSLLTHVLSPQHPYFETILAHGPRHISVSSRNDLNASELTAAISRVSGSCHLLRGRIRSGC
jgi:hypothetical protein